MQGAPAFLDEAAAMAERALDAAVPAVDVAPTRLHQAMRHALLAGGKRLRPALVLAAARACGGEAEAAIPGMVAMECLHTYTLVHDDLPAMDDDDLRRGQPTVHKAFDEATAILVGDALQALAFGQCALLGAEAVTALAEAAGSLGVVGGQQDDLDAEGRRVGADLSADMALLERIHRRKTAALIRFSCQLGAIAAGAGPEQQGALAAYGEALGLAFQITDDVLDCTADTAALGKTAGKDVAVGKLTWVACHGLDGARAAAQEQAYIAERATVSLGAAAEPLRELVRFVVERDH
jgi:geranylgeranyl pyrophosphate synthase